MSVPMYERSESSMEFIKRTLDLNAKVGTYVVKMPPKYKMLYGDDMAKTGLAALRMLQTGNGIFVSKDTIPAVFEERIKLFETARGYIYNDMLKTIESKVTAKKNSYRK